MENQVLFLIENTFFISFLVGTIYLIAASITLKFPPKKINYLYGYRTNLSMQNQETWNFSQRFSSLAMIKASVGLIVVSCANYFIKMPEKPQLIVGIGLIIGATLYIFYTTEKAIKKNFPNR